jgi:CCR4-NOT transcription complex subunit 10
MAFDCFEEASQLLYNQPKLWLRMAECCIAYHSQQQQQQTGEKYRGNSLRSAGRSARTRRVLLPLGSASRLHAGASARLENCVLEDDPSLAERKAQANGARVEKLSLEYARSCLQNCLILVSKSTFYQQPAAQGGAAQPAQQSIPGAGAQKLAAGASGSASAANASSGVNGTPPANGDEQDRMRDGAQLRQAALVNLGFVSLSLAEPMQALQYCRELLEISDGLLDTYRYLAHLYMAEAMCLLNRPAEAAVHLAPNIIPPNSGSANAQVANPVLHRYTNCQPNPSSPAARATLYLNMATVHILQDNLGHASAAVSQALAINPSCSNALLTAAYLEMRKGKTDVGLQILRRRRLQPMPRQGRSEK